MHAARPRQIANASAKHTSECCQPNGGGHSTPPNDAICIETNAPHDHVLSMDHPTHCLRTMHLAGHNTALHYNAHLHLFAARARAPYSIRVRWTFFSPRYPSPMPPCLRARRPGLLSTHRSTMVTADTACAWPLCSVRMLLACAGLILYMREMRGLRCAVSGGRQRRPCGEARRACSMAALGWPPPFASAHHLRHLDGRGVLLSARGR